MIEIACSKNRANHEIMTAPPLTKEFTNRQFHPDDETETTPFFQGHH